MGESHRICGFEIRRKRGEQQSILGQFRHHEDVVLLQVGDQEDPRTRLVQPEWLEQSGRRCTLNRGHRVCRPQNRHQKLGISTRAGHRRWLSSSRNSLEQKSNLWREFVADDASAFIESGSAQRRYVQEFPMLQRLKRHEQSCLVKEPSMSNGSIEGPTDPF